jgi:hypothetical protein
MTPAVIVLNDGKHATSVLPPAVGQQERVVTVQNRPDRVLLQCSHRMPAQTVNNPRQF